MSLFGGYLDENGGGETGAAMTPREKHPQGPPNLGTCNTWHSLQVAQQAGDFLSRCLIWSKRFPGYLGWFLLFPCNWGAPIAIFSAPLLRILTSTSLGEALVYCFLSHGGT